MKKIYFFLIALFVSLTMNAGEVTEQQALQKAQQFMQGKKFKQTNLRRAASIAGNAYYVFNAENKSGFVIVAGDDRMPDILGYAERGNFNTTKIPTNVKWLMDYYTKVAQSLKNSKDTKATRRAATERAEVKPLMKTTWDQGDPYNLHVPVIEEGYQTPTGCVATAMAQVINFLQWPLNEVKEMPSYQTSTTKTTVTALPARKFNWYNMTDDEIAWLMRYCGQSVSMDYNTSESGAAPSFIPSALSSIFGFSKNVKLVVHQDIADAEWEEMMYNEVNLGRPVIYSGFQGTSGHSFVLHGYKEGKFMVNWGWGGDFDGYFTLTNLAPNEYLNWAQDQNAVIGIQPVSEEDAVIEEIAALGEKTINIEQAGTLSQYISDEEKITIKSLTLTGEINGTDIKFLRDMCGEERIDGIAQNKGNLQELDLSGVRIVEGGDCYDGDNNTANDVLGNGMFSYCQISSIVLPNTLQTIDQDAFAYSKLTSIIIPKQVNRLGIGIFRGTPLSSIQVEEGNATYRAGGNAVYEKESGKLVLGCASTVIPEGVKVIGSYAFYGQNSLKTIKLPETLTDLEDYAFAYSGLTTLTIPKNVNNIGYEAFRGVQFWSIIVDTNNTKYDSRNNCNAIIETATNTLIVGCAATEIPTGVTAIADHAFQQQNYLSSIVFPTTLVSIGQEAFSDDYELKTIEIPEQTKSIGNHAFNGINFNIVKVHFQDPIEITELVFGGISDKTKLIVPDGTKSKYETSTGWNKFSQIIETSSYITGHTLNVATAGTLSELISDEEKYTIEELTLTGELNGTDLEFLHQMMGYDGNLYNPTEGKLGNLDISEARIVAGGTPVSQADIIGKRTFENGYSLKSISLPKTLKSIEWAAFETCGLTSIVIPKSVEMLGSDVFYYCPLVSISVEEGNPVFDSRDNCNAVIETATNTLRIGCRKTVIPNSVTSIGVTAFSGRRGLVSMPIPDGVTTIGDYAFWSDEELTSVSIAKTVTNFGDAPYGGCGNITSFIIDPENPNYDSRNNCNAIIETATNTLIQGFGTTIIPDGIVKIAYGAFRSQDNLTSINIPSSVTTIEAEAFLYCNNLLKVVSHIKKPYSLSVNVFDGDNIAKATLYVPYGTSKAYASTPGWNNFNRIVEMEPDDSYQNNAASIAIKDFDKHYAALNGEVKVPISITGEGITPITSIDYTITTGSNSKEYHLDVEPISYMMTAEVLIPFAADATIGEQAKTLKITKVNGVANECAENVSATGTLMTVMKKPKIIPVVEEYTGTWCGWCVKGMVGLKLLNKEFGKDVITIAIHDGTDNEPMILPEYRSVSGTYPSCQINRGEMMDPYFGTNNQAFGIKKEVEAVQRDYALGGIEMEAEWTDDSQTAINIKTTTTFVEDVAESPYQIGYVLLEDGLTGTGDAWAQSNYYAGSSTSDENLKKLTSKPSKITDMKYDHVPVAAWEPMTGVTGTIPTTITHDVPMEYTFKADISGNIRIQNKNKLTVVVLLIDKETGKIINANKYAMGGSFIPGDVNGDGLVNVTDIVATVNFIMEKPSDNFNKEAADLNGDGEVNVTDIVMMVSIIMNGDGSSSRRAAATSSHLVINRNNIQLKNAEAYTAAQFDINLSDGQSINNVVLNVSSDHSLYWKMVDANTYRVVVYSMTNAAFRANSDNLFTVFMTGSQNATISNELLIKAENTTGIDAIRTEAEKGNVYDLNGRQVKNPRKGVYIINGRKVVVK